ncbi:hypothetical protein H6775_00455 [Candidatus Nomurabacteria bacterium]|nr:hypothetical protein [Candidatus Nomurabacteria bacterium]
MFKKFFKKKKGRSYHYDISPDDIFLDSQNLPDFNVHQFEGRIEKPIGKKTLIFLGSIFLLIGIFFSFRVWGLQVKQGEEYLNLSEQNRLRHTLVFANRGNIYDKNDTPLVWNLPSESKYEFSQRKYIEDGGFANLLGYVKYPQKDKYGFYYEESFQPFNGLEAIYNDILSGQNGLRIIETDALQDIVSENTVRHPENGENIKLTIDADVQNALFTSIKEIADQVGFKGGGGVIMNIHNGDILALTSYPEFDPNVMTDGSNKEQISNYLNDPSNPFLNRVISGLYTPGSIMKPYVAIGALNEGVIDQYTNIVSRGTLEVPNPYNPSQPSVFSDWKAHGPVDVRKAIAVSSNIYFYVVGGGFQDQEGLGISRLEEYYRKFGFGETVDGDFFDEQKGTIPNPEWKEKIFDGDPWRLGDTYFTAIGQYGVQVTPIQVVRAVSAIANDGTLINPKLVESEETEVVSQLDEISLKNFKIVQEGMRQSVLDGIARGLNASYVEIAGKTGTAELGVTKERVNSWVVGFWPYQNPKYAFAIVMEQGLRTNLIGGVAVGRRVFDWLHVYKPEYLE